MEERCQCGVWDENCEHCNHRDTEITRLTAELEKKDGYIEDLEGTIDSLRDEMDYPKRYDKDGFPDDDGCYADAYETTDKITRLTAEIAVLREVLVNCKPWIDHLVEAGFGKAIDLLDDIRAALDAVKEEQCP